MEIIKNRLNEINNRIDEIISLVDIYNISDDESIDTIKNEVEEYKKEIKKITDEKFK